MASTPNSEAMIRETLAELKRAFMTDDLALQARCRLRLHEFGTEAGKLLLGELKEQQLEKIEWPEALRVTIGLVHTLHDIDETQSMEFIDKALEGDCHPSIEAALRAIRRYESGGFRETSFKNTRIFEQISIDPEYRASEYVIKWLSKLPPNDIREIRRIFIMSDELDRDYLGNYGAYFEVITIVWSQTFRPSSLLAFLPRLTVEATLYHEVGHHFFRHQEMGQVPDQEEEADFYKRRHMRKSHPFLYGFTRLVRWLLLPVAALVRLAARTWLFHKKAPPERN